MTFRHALLPVGGLLVLGLAVYLFVEVRAQPAQLPPAAAEAVHPSARAARAPESQAPPTARSHAAAPEPAPSPAPARALEPRSRDDQEAIKPAPREVAVPDASAPLAGPKLDAVMDEGNKAYDRGDFEEARQIAARVLAQEPTNVRMLRIVVSASCIEGDSAAAQTAYARLPVRDQEQMRIRCARYGIAFAER